MGDAGRGVARTRIRGAGPLSPGVPRPSRVRGQPRHRAPLPLHGGDLGNSLGRVGGFRLPVRSLRRHAGRSGWGGTPHRAGGSRRRSVAGRSGEDRCGRERVHGFAVGQCRSQRGHHGHLHHSPHAKGGLPTVLRRCDRGGGQHRWTTDAPGHGCRSLYSRHVDEHPVSPSGDGGGHPGDPLLRGPTLRHPLPGLTDGHRTHRRRGSGGGVAQDSPAGASDRDRSPPGSRSLTHAGGLLGCHIHRSARVPAAIDPAGGGRRPGRLSGRPVRVQFRWPRLARRRESWSASPRSPGSGSACRSSSLRFRRAI